MRLSFLRFAQLQGQHPEIERGAHDTVTLKEGPARLGHFNPHIMFRLDAAQVLHVAVDGNDAFEQALAVVLSRLQKVFSCRA